MWLKNKPDLSVIVPVYNTKSYLVECLDSILSQKGISFELICIDDGSDDGCFSILESYKCRYSDRMILLHQDNKGVSAARNLGIRHANGEYLYFMDSDDRLLPGALMRIFGFAKEMALDVLFFSFRNFVDTDIMRQRYGHMLQGKKRSMQVLEPITGRELLIKFIRSGEYYVVVWCQCIRRSFLENHRLLFPEGICFEDQTFTFMELYYAKQTACIDDILYEKRIRENSIVTAEDKSEYLKGHCATIACLNKIFTQREFIKETDYLDAVHQLRLQTRQKIIKVLENAKQADCMRYIKTVYEEILEYHLYEDPEKTTPLVSLCIPTNGVEKWLIAVLDSIYEQEVPDHLFEVIVSDNAKDSKKLKVLEIYRAAGHVNLMYSQNNSPMFMNEIEAYRLATGTMQKFINHRTILQNGALETYIVYAYLYQDTKPVIFFSNGVLGNWNVSRFQEFGKFLCSLGRWASWSTGINVWRDDFKTIDAEEEYNEWFPHMAFLLSERLEKDYMVVDYKLLKELPVGNTGKGRYDVFYVFAEILPGVFKQLKISGRITDTEYKLIMDELLDHIAFLYSGYVKYKKRTSYLLDGYERSVSRYFSDAQVQEMVDRKYLRHKKSEIQCRMISILLCEIAPKDCYRDAQVYLSQHPIYKQRIEIVRKTLQQKYQYVRSDTVVLSIQGLRSKKHDQQMRMLRAYLDENLDYLILDQSEEGEQLNKEILEFVLRYAPHVRVIS